jgi:hypothetical protein
MLLFSPPSPTIIRARPPFVNHVFSSLNSPTVNGSRGPPNTTRSASPKLSAEISSLFLYQHLQKLQNQISITPYV